MGGVRGKKAKKKRQKNPRKNGENLNFWGVKNGKKKFDFFLREFWVKKQKSFLKIWGKFESFGNFGF